MGDGNMLDVLHAGLHATQMMGYTEIMNAYRFHYPQWRSGNARD